ncbi:Coiled-coil-helix-coiled-coil-helix domain-containing protein 2, mitochondrial [Tupaia chinensis]|uniref:Coiled-coil-helix-coiled-coil-helix domain-containing protein 2, mitochondrial n=1 Tax=Tupaia chinensis TaxID=246437 RepID=L9KHS4_TUPCH|nr:Coiled-coil-helix-coiled-coil-helix domain-containing protein 2, mitochondrial [Tupaia chinensis]
MKQKGRSGVQHLRKDSAGAASQRNYRLAWAPATCRKPRGPAFIAGAGSSRTAARTHSAPSPAQPPVAAHAALGPNKLFCYFQRFTSLVEPLCDCDAAWKLKRSSCLASPASRASQMRAAPRPAAQPPVVAPPSAVSSPSAAPQAARSDGQMATTAVGVAVGSAVGHTLRPAITGGFRGGSNAELSRPDITYQEPQGTQHMSSSSSLDLATMR